MDHLTIYLVKIYSNDFAQIVTNKKFKKINKKKGCLCIKINCYQMKYLPRFLNGQKDFVKIS